MYQKYINGSACSNQKEIDLSAAHQTNRVIEALEDIVLNPGKSMTSMNYPYRCIEEEGCTVEKVESRKYSVLTSGLFILHV